MRHDIAEHGRCHVLARAALLLLVIMAGCRLEDHKMDVEIRDAWVRPAPAGANSAAYLVFENETAAAVTVDSVLADVARRAEIHETMIGEGMAHMRALGALSVPVDSTVVLRPGGMHVMLVGLQRELVPGDRVSLTFVLSGGRRTEVQAIVREQ